MSMQKTNINVKIQKGGTKEFKFIYEVVKQDDSLTATLLNLSLEYVKCKWNIGAFNVTMGPSREKETSQNHIRISERSERRFTPQVRSETLERKRTGWSII